MSRAISEAPSAPEHLKSEEVPTARGLPTPPAALLQTPPPFGERFVRGTAFCTGLYRPAWELEAVHSWLRDYPGGFERKPVST